MKRICVLLVCLLSCCLGLVGTALAQTNTVDGDLQDKGSQQVLRAMTLSDNQNHPDLHGQFGGIERYAKGDYAGAMKYFLVGARYADKVSQLCIGLLYLHGEGVAKNPAAAYAWVAVAAERNYPQFVATRDQLWAQLDSNQREQAKAEQQQLLTEYGDAVAKPRMVAQLQQGMLGMTGSRVGYVGNLQTETLDQAFGHTNSMLSQQGQPLPSCAAGSVEGSNINGCGNYWAASNWRPRDYFASRDAFWKGTVTVGPLQNVNAPSNAPPLGSAPSAQ